MTGSRRKGKHVSKVSTGTTGPCSPVHGDSNACQQAAWRAGLTNTQIQMLHSTKPQGQPPLKSSAVQYTAGLHCAVQYAVCRAFPCSTEQG